MTAATVEFSARGTVITFRGFLAAYEEGATTTADATPRATRSGACPSSAEGVALTAVRAEADGHETSPPPRYTEATLVKAMEEKGIGRPSTYASIMGTIQDRGYVGNRGSALIPTWLAFAVTRLLEEHFSSPGGLRLHRLHGGGPRPHRQRRRAARPVARRFYFGDEAKTMEGLRHLVEDLGEIDAREISTIPIGEGIVVRVGRYGPYVEETLPEGVDLATGEVADGATGTPRRATITDDIAPDEMTPAKARELLEQSSDDGRVIGQDPETGRDIVAKAGRYGPYVTEVLDEETAALKGKSKVKPRTASLFKDMDLASLDLDDALKLLSLPRRRGHRPRRASRSPRRTAATARTSRRAPTRARWRAEEQLFDITLEEALAIYAQPKQRGRGAGTAPLKELGNDPVSGRPMVVKDGRFGPYVTDGETNATLRKDDDPESITPERGCRAARREAGQGAHDPQARGQEDHHQEDRRQEDHGQEGDRQEEHREEGLTSWRSTRQPRKRSRTVSPWSSRPSACPRWRPGWSATVSSCGPRPSAPSTVAPRGRPPTRAPSTGSARSPRPSSRSRSCGCGTRAAWSSTTASAPTCTTPRTRTSRSASSSRTPRACRPRPPARGGSGWRAGRGLTSWPRGRS